MERSHNMNIHHGLVIEQDISNALNGKKVCELSHNMRHLIKTLFPTATDDSIVTSKPYEDVYKADILISCEGQNINLSIKTGKSEMLHNEILEKFLNYLGDNHISQKTLDIIRLFHYGDGTLDGTGERRMDYNEIMFRYGEKIQEANYELNANREFVIDVVNRVTFDGANEDYIKADAIYCGDLEYGVIATRKQVKKHLLKKYYSYYKSLHIGPILLRPDARYCNQPIKDIRKRNRIVATWPKLTSDIGYIGDRYDF